MFQSDLLKGKTILVTGGGSGLGLAMSQRFAGLGANVAICGRTGSTLEDAAGEIDPSGGRVFAHPCDVSDFGQMEATVAATVERFGAVDGLVNNAAGNFLAASEELSPGGFDRVVKIVLHGTFHATLAAGRRMIEAGGGTILNIVTTYAWTGSPFVVPSAAAKAGVLAMTRSLAVEWAAYKVRVNAIAPGPFPTEGAWKRLMASPEMEREAKARVPLRRFGEQQELADLAAYLMADGSAYVNGECVTIDGGAWLASGGQFSGLLRVPRAELKGRMEEMKKK